MTERARPDSGGPRWGRIGAAAAAVGAVVIVAVVLLAGGGGGDEEGGGGGTAVAPDPQVDGTAAAVEGFPVGVAVNGELVTVASREGTLTSIDKESHEVRGQPYELPGPAEDVVVDGDTAWVSLWDDDQVAEVALGGDGTPESDRTIDVGTEPRGMVMGEDTVWVANLLSASLTAIPKSGDAPTEIALPPGTQPADIDFTGDALWVSDRRGKVLKVALATGEVTEEVDVGRSPKGIAVLDDEVWVANAESGSVTRIGPGGETRDFEVSGTPRGVEAGFGRIWVANGGTGGEDGSGGVNVIDPADPASFETVEIGGSPEEVAVGPNHVWVTTGEGEQVFSITP